jgi:predicted acetyltransferase
MEMRPVTADEFPTFLRTTESAFHEDVHDDDLASWRMVFEPERSLAVFDGPEMVATAAIFTRELTIPGGLMSVAGVTAVGVLASHRRRGLLTGLMRRQIDDVRAAGESVAALWASEGTIYGRFGYGLAARHATVSLRTAGAGLHPDLPAPAGRTTLVAPADVVPRIAPLYERVRRERVGHLDRAGAWWDRRVDDPEHHRNGRNALRAAVHEDEDGEVDGYALYAVESIWNDGPDAKTSVREMVADGAAATAAMWSYLIGLDLTRNLAYWIAAPDTPFTDLLRGPHRPRVDLGQNLWVRLVDVDAALAARTYAAPFEAVFDVADAFCPWNAGRRRLAWDGTTARCEPTAADPDIALTATDLGAAYLGGTSLAALAAIGRVRELRPGTLAPVATAFKGTREPWCPEIF